MDEAVETVQRVRKLLENQRFAVLSTCEKDGNPYGSLVAFAASEDLSVIAFATMRATRKFANISDEPRVSLLIDDRSNQETDLRAAMAVTARGLSREARGAERDRLVKLLLAKQPTMKGFVSSPGCAVVGVEVEQYITVTRFQNVIELHLEAGGVHVVDQATQ